MKRLTLILLAILIDTQYPVKAIWVGHRDYSTRDEWINDFDDETYTKRRRIDLSFAKAKPNDENLTFSRCTQEAAKGKLEDLWRVKRYTELSFDDVASYNHLQLLMEYVENFDLENGSIDVNFNKKAPSYLKELWNKFYERLQSRTDRRLQAKAEKRERRQRRYDDHLDSNPSWETAILEQDGFFSSDGD